MCIRHSLAAICCAVSVLVSVWQFEALECQGIRQSSESMVETRNSSGTEES